MNQAEAASLMQQKCTFAFALYALEWKRCVFGTVVEKKAIGAAQ